jgi:putative aldouronate transport system substrate-binding protein
MKNKRSMFIGVFVTLILVFIIVACAPKTVEVEKIVTQVVKEEVTVMVAGTSVVKEVEVEVVVTATPSAPVEITYTYPGSGVPNDLQEVEDAINEILIPKINVKLTLDPVDWGTFGERQQLKMAAGEECDIVFVAPWINNYYLNVINGALYPLDDLLPEYAPGYWASISPSSWEAARLQGHIYAGINQQIWPKPWGVHVIKEYADKYNLDLSEIRRFEDMEPFNDAILAGEGGEVTPYCQRSIPFYLQYHGFTEMGSGDGAGISVKYDDPTVVNVFASEEWQEHAKLNRKWYLAGYVFQDDVPNIDETIMAKLCGWDSHVEKPNQNTDLKSKYGFNWIFKNLTDPLILDTGGLTATMNGVCATSKSPESAVKVLEMLNTNKDVYRLISYGIEGKHWVWVDKDLDIVSLPEGVVQSESGYFPNTDWMFGNQFNAPYRDEETARLDAWELTRRMNNSAVPHILLGYTFDSKPVENEVAQVTAVAAEFCAPVLSGLVDFEGNYETCLEKVEAAGINIVIEEAQRQVDEFMASK